MKGIYTSLLESFELFEEEPAPSSAQSLQFSATPEKIARFKELLGKAQASYDARKHAQGQAAYNAGAATGGSTQASKPAAAQSAPTSQKVDNKVFAMQGELINAGAKIEQDGIMGQQTQTAMGQYPDVAAKFIKPTSPGTTQSTQGAQPTIEPASPVTNTPSSSMPPEIQDRILKALDKMNSSS